MIKLTYNFFKSSNKSIFFIISFYNFFFTYIKISKDSLAKYYQDKKERLQKKARARYQSLSKEEREKKQQYGHEQ